MLKKKPDPPREYKVGDRILANLHRGRIEEATITAIIESTSGKKLQVDFGKDMTALIDTRQVVEEWEKNHPSFQAIYGATAFRRAASAFDAFRLRRVSVVERQFFPCLNHPAAVKQEVAVRPASEQVRVAAMESKLRGANVMEKKKTILKATNL